MRCDYYIAKYLRVYCNDDTELSIKIEQDRGIYNFWGDEDEDNYEYEYEEYKRKQLISTFEPITLYSDGHFSNPRVEQKYKIIIAKLLEEHNKTWEEITSIAKVEERFE